MEAQQDFKELLQFLNCHSVKYMVVGGYALAFHGAPRYTGDIDIFIKPDPENGEKVLAALKDFGFGSLGIKLSDLCTEDKVIQLGYPPVRIDIITSVTGIKWEEAEQNMVEGKYGDVEIKYIGLKELVKNKKAVGRYRDLADLESLGIKV